MVAGNGFEPLEALLAGKPAVVMVVWLGIAEPVATAMSVGFGNPGGAFTAGLRGAGDHRVISTGWSARPAGATAGFREPRTATNRNRRLE
jgi:CIC family chloride channel protein